MGGTRMVGRRGQLRPLKGREVGMPGVGTERPKVAKESFNFPKLSPPTWYWAGRSVDPQAMRAPAAMATRPAGMPPYFTPPNQLTRMMAKQTMPMTGGMNISSAGFLGMKGNATPPRAPTQAGLGGGLLI